MKKIIDYIVGHVRYYLFYSEFNSWIRKHIYEQIEFRIEIMNRECYNRGTCIHCGCMVTALQMVKRVCEGDCYPPLLSKFKWKKLLRGDEVYDSEHFWRIEKYPHGHNMLIIKMYKDRELIIDKIVEQ